MEEKLVSSTTMDGIYCDIHLTNLKNNSEKYEENMLKRIIKFLKDRFLNYEDISSATEIFYLFSWPPGKQLDKYGDSIIKNLATHFYKQLNLEQDSTE